MNNQLLEMMQTARWFMAAFVKIGIVRPATVLFIAAVVMVYLSGGVQGSAKAYLESVAEMAMTGPAPEGYVNMKVCAQNNIADAQSNVIGSIKCERHEIETISIEQASSDVASSLSRAIFVIYLFAVVIGSLIPLPGVNHLKQSIGLLIESFKRSGINKSPR